MWARTILYNKVNTTGFVLHDYNAQILILSYTLDINY